MEMHDYWRATGKYFGFPSCCIEAFLHMEHSHHIRKLHGTGYIPCPSCNEKPEAVLIAQINANREHPEPFPITSMSIFIPWREAWEHAYKQKRFTSC